MYLTGTRMGRLGAITAREFFMGPVPAALPSSRPSSQMVSRGTFVYTPPAISVPPPSPSPAPLAPVQPIPPILPVGPVSAGTFTYTPPASAPPAAPQSTANANAGTPVPAGFPTNQIFVASDGSFWEYSGTQWVNVGTPYNTGASAGVPPVTQGTTPSAPTSLSTPTTGGSPVSVSIAAPSSGYQEILDWLQEDTLGATIGFSIPNWIVVGAAAALAWKFTQGSRRRNPSRLRAYRRRSR